MGGGKDEREETDGGPVMASEKQIFATKASINLSAFMDSADAVLLPSVFRAFEREFDVGPTVLGTISLAQSLAQSLSSPFWGYFADTTSRRLLLALGCAIVGVATVLVAISSNITQVTIFRMITGLGLAACGPIAQSLISDLVPPNKRGRAFGWLGFMTGLGSMVGTLFATSVSQKVFFGSLAGWRLAYLATAVFGLALSLTVWIVAFDPKRGGSDVHAPDTPAEHREGAAETTPLLIEHDVTGNDGGRDSAQFGDWLWETVQFFKIRTFTFIVINGLFGCIPWSAMHFAILYLQYVGFKDSVASSILSCFYFGGMLGNYLGGWLGDRAARWSPDYGRVLTAQLSELLRIPFVCTLFLLLPPDTSLFYVYAIVMFCQGLVGTWCGACCNRPILSEVVAPSSRSSVFAMLTAMESSIGALGAPMVGILAEQVFGYKQSELTLEEMPPAQRDDNRQALAYSAVFVMAIPWTMCIFLYGLVHTVYPKERHTVTAEWKRRVAEKAE